jgi:hypothetical protein
MNLPQILTYEVKTSRTEHKVPVVNGVHLHSIYNPLKEAEALVTAQMENLKKKKEVLILGLGFSYHVNAVTEYLANFHGDDFKVIVIEPNIEVYEDCINRNLINKKNVLIYSGFTSKELYSDLDLVHFLLRKPAIIAHPPSFNLYQNYFKDILTFEAPEQIKSILGFVTSLEIKNYFDAFSPDATFNDVLFKEVPNQNHFKQMDFLTMALLEITKKSQNGNTNLGDN